MRIKVIFCCIVLWLSIFQFGSNVYAETETEEIMIYNIESRASGTIKARTTKPYKLSGGVGAYGSNRRYYYVDSSCQSTNLNLPNVIASAWNDWINTSNILETSISVRNTTVKSNSVFDFYCNYDENTYSYLYAWTEWYPNSSSQIQVSKNSEGLPAENWDWTQIIINYTKFSELLSLEYEGEYYYRKGVIAHEIGHAMGLAHMVNSTESRAIKSIMHIYGNMNTDQCEYIDLEGINTLYN